MAGRASLSHNPTLDEINGLSSPNTTGDIVEVALAICCHLSKKKLNTLSIMESMNRPWGCNQRLIERNHSTKQMEDQNDVFACECSILTPKRLAGDREDLVRLLWLQRASVCHGACGGGYGGMWACTPLFQGESPQQEAV